MINSFEQSSQMEWLALQNNIVDIKSETIKTSQINFQIIWEMASANMYFKMVKTQLELSQETVENEIIQLQMSHIKELENSINPQKITINQVVSKIQLILKKLSMYRSCSEFNSMYIISESDFHLFRKLTLDVSKYDYYAQNTSPRDLRVNQSVLMHNNYKITFPEDAAIGLIKTDPSIEPQIINALNEYKTLKSEILPLENKLNYLIAKKEGMILFHAEYLKEIKKDKKLVPFMKVLELIKEAFNTIDWNNLLTIKNYKGFKEDNLLGEILSTQILDHLKNDANKKINKVKNQMLHIIANLEEIIKEGS